MSYLEGGSGPGLVFLHSLGASADLWRPQLRAFARDHHVLAPDLRGHGATTARSGLTAGQLAGDVYSLAGGIRGGSLVAIGLSMGSNVALQLAATSPRLIRGLVLASAFTSPPPEVQDVPTGISDEAEKIIDMSEYAHLRADRMLRRPEAAGEDFFTGARQMSKSALVQMGRALARWNVSSLLPAIKVPVLLLTGAEDPYVTPAMTQEIASHLADAQVRFLDGAGHICNVDAPDVFHAAVREFLERIEADHHESS